MNNLAVPPLPALLLQGLDSLYVSFYLDVTNSALDLDEIAYQRERLRQSRDGKFTRIELGSEAFALKTHGRFPYSYVIENELFSVAFAERMQPSFHVQFLSKGLWQEGLDGLELRFRSWAESMGLVEQRLETVSRADWAFDFHVPVVDFSADHLLSKARKTSAYKDNRALQTIVAGKGDVVIRLYDKVAEIEESSGKSFFYELWGRTSEIWRVEFQLRGERLKPAGVRSLDDLRGLQGDLLRELTHNHTSLRRPTGDSNLSRWPLHPLWTALQAEIGHMPQSGLIRDIDEKRLLEYRIHRQTQSIYGSLKGLAALLSIAQGEAEALSLRDLIGQLEDELVIHHEHPVWERDVRTRIEGYALGQW
ncbi:hypothetical protein [Oceanibaculum indicum]|uniref:Replication initiation factor n=1 Tax=Oceanibaculum indicum P24 TaxID=1207063 RepID=K2K4K6_9PROT|nr:hypothetical protein [Oceanibaculum indicum]EKE72420.1 hypothetical protein P24_13473 [Oceanibaculum indicum P24]